MWKWFVVLVLLEIVLTPTPVFAETSQDVTVTATGYVVGSPTELTLTYISDYEVGISWTKGEDAVNTMVRVKYGEIPQSRTDGYQVYYGEGTSSTDPNIVLAGADIPYYKAWSQNAGGVWEEFGISEEVNFMSASFLFIGMILIAVSLTAFAYKIRLILFTMAAASSWLGLGIWLLLSDSTNLQMSDTWTQVIGFVFVMMTIAVLTLQMRTDIRHEKSVRGNIGGYPGAASESWTEWGPKAKKKNLSAMERQTAYRKRIRGGR